MADEFLKLSDKNRRDALEVAAAELGRPAHLLEKDVWVVWALRTLFESPIGNHLIFKGGTSLSKAYGAIKRFSEDVDVTYDIRAIASDLVGDDDALPPSRSQAAKWTKVIRERLPLWIKQEISPLINGRLSDQGLLANVIIEGDTASLDYSPIATGTGYSPPRVLLEFGARSTGEPAEHHPIVCDAAAALPSLTFPEATPRVMSAERTFWEKATAIHVYCKRGEFRGGDRYSRHWYDLVCLDDVGIAANALDDRKLAYAVAHQKSLFFSEKDNQGTPIDYVAAINKELSLVPNGAPLDALKEDYEKMLADGLLFDDAVSFDQLIDRIAAIEAIANK